MREDSEYSRREFLVTGAKGALGLGVVGSGLSISSPRGVLGANDRVRVAVCGVRGQGFEHIRAAAQIPNVEVAALCDVDENVWRKRLVDLERRNIPKPALYYSDVRKLLEDKSIDAISIATPNHWHALIGIWACQAGKDVYVEKPCSHNGWEGRQLVRAAQKYNRIVQHGTQSRSAPSAQEAIQKIHDGLIGEVYLARGLCFKWRDTIGRAPAGTHSRGRPLRLVDRPGAAPALHQEPLPLQLALVLGLRQRRLGQPGHPPVDMARWGLGVKFPNKVSAIGGHFMFDDDQETPNTLNCAFQFDLPGGKRKMIEFEVRHWIGDREAGIGSVEMGGEKGDSNVIGDIFFGSQGYLAIGDEDTGNAYKSWLGREQTPGPSRHEGGQHYANFIDCVRSRRKEDLNAPIEEGHVSATLMHLANASYRLGRTLSFDSDTEQVIGDEEANRLLRDADRAYRDPFVVPENV